jgi:hypothetical protein
MLSGLFKGGSDNEFGAVLPAPEAQLCEESESIRAFSKPDADRKCAQITEEYGGIEPKTEHTGRSGEYDCKFKVWR